MKKIIFVLLAITIIIVACSTQPVVFPKSDNGFWFYQLQDFDPNNADISKFKYGVIDYSKDGTETTKYTASEISIIKAKGVTILCYISIGEAENYRYYWQSGWNTTPPLWLGRENSDWEGNYKVRFWDTNWQSIIYGYLDKIIDAGFDGAYLDIIEAYAYWADNENQEGYYTNEDISAIRMIEFVTNIAMYCRTNGNSNFLIFPQNGENILRFDSNSGYLNTVSGIGVEDVFYYGTNYLNSTLRKYRLNYFGDFLSAKKVVLSVDYLDDGSGFSTDNAHRIEDYFLQVNHNGIVPYVANMDRELNSINTIDKIQP